MCSTQRGPISLGYANLAPLLFIVTSISGYIGKKHLSRAIEHVLSEPLTSPTGEQKPLAFSVIRVPFFLEPHYDETKPYIESNRSRLIKKWGGEAGWEVQKQRHDLKGRGLEAGIPHFNLDRLAANSMASHRLIQHLGKKYGLHVSEEVYDLLNVYYFVDGHSLNDRPRLARVVAEKLQELVASDDEQPAAMSEMDILDFLDSDEGRAEIELALSTLDQLGVHGIPKFIIEGQTVVDGAARSEVFINIFRKIERRGFVQRGPIFGDILGISNDIIERGSHRSEDIAA